MIRTAPYLMLLAAGLLASCSGSNKEIRSEAQAEAAKATPGQLEAHDARLQDAYQLDTVCNGITVSADGRAFVCFPHVDGSPGSRIAELVRGKVVAYPDVAWNSYNAGSDPAQKIIRANSLRIGPDGMLWIIDTGTLSEGDKVIKGGPKLIAIDLKTNQVARTIPLGDYVKDKSFVDDFRFNGSTIYVSDAGEPAMIVLDGKTGKGRRVLENAECTTDNQPMYAENRMLTTPEGKQAKIHADQLEVSPDGKLLYFQTAAGPTYVVETRYMDDASLSGDALAKQVRLFYKTSTTGGTCMDAEGNYYVSDASHNRILKITPEGSATTLIEDARLVWPDALWIDSKGTLWIPAPQMNRTASKNGGKEAVEMPMHIYSLPIKAKSLAT